MKYVVNAFSNLFFPNVCVVCGRELLDSEVGGCLFCISRLPLTNSYKYKHNSLEQLLAGRFPFERAISFCYYTQGGVLQPMIHALKYYGRQEIGEMLGQIFGRQLVDSEAITDVDFIVPIPLHKRRQKERGYNQADAIARGLAKVLNIPIESNIVERVVYNPTQTKKGRMQRWENVEGIFNLKNKSQFSGKHILLIDDIITTGSTMEACATTLLSCKDIKISVAVLGEVI